MDFLKLWKNYPVLWHDSPTHTDTVYLAAVGELTNQINNKRNLSITNPGMTITLRRIRRWFHTYKSSKRISDDAKDIFKQDYFGKCSEFLSKHETRTVTCDKCHCLFTDEAHLQSHVANKHQTFCDICQKDYGRPFNYRQHALKHEPPKLECNICGKKYFYLEVFRDHMRAHRNERNHVCEKCGKAFVRQKNLKNHTLQKHYDKNNPATMHKRQPCAICDIEFKNSSELSLHRKKKHLVLEGTIEQLSSKSKYGVRQTRKRTFTVDPITKQRRIVCEVCDNSYAHLGGMYRHMVSAHGFVRPGQRLKVAQQTHSSFAKLNTDILGKPNDMVEQQNSDESELEEIDDDDDDVDNDDGILFSEDQDYDNDSEGVDYEYIEEFDLEY